MAPVLPLRTAWIADILSKASLRDVERQRCWKRGSGDGQRLWDYCTERSFNDTWSDHFSVKAKVKPRWETVHTCCSLSPPWTRFLPVSQPCLPTTICWLLAELKVAFQQWRPPELRVSCLYCWRLFVRVRLCVSCSLTDCTLKLLCLCLVKASC